MLRMMNNLLSKPATLYLNDHVWPAPLGKNYTGGVRSVLLKGMHVWGPGCLFRERGAGNLRATKSCVFASCMVLEIMVLKLDECEFRQIFHALP